MEEKNVPGPAILGGVPSVTEEQILSNRWPVITEEDEQAVLKIMRDGNISTHPVIRELEKDYADYFGRQYALAHNNGTSALLAAFYSIGLRPGDEVLVPSATFWASVLPMLWLGAIPVFCESEGDRLGIDPEDMEKKITDKTKAIVIVHLWGLPSKMSEINAIAKKYNLKIIEDASHAHGAYWRDKPCGSLGDVSVFSLQGDKLAPGGEGGIYLCSDYSLYERAVCLGDITRIIELQTPARRFAATSFGIKTRISPLSAAIARVQLRYLEERNEKRNTNIKYISSCLEKMGFHTYMSPEHIKRVYFEFLIRNDRTKTGLPVDLLISSLRAEGCLVSAPRYPLLHQQPFFTEGAFKEVLRLPADISAPVYKPDALPKTESMNCDLIKLPSFPCAKQGLLDQYILAFEKVTKYASLIIANSENIIKGE